MYTTVFTGDILQLLPLLGYKKKYSFNHNFFYFHATLQRYTCLSSCIPCLKNKNSTYKMGKLEQLPFINQNGGGSVKESCI